MGGKADLDAVDRDALERCMEIANRDPLRAEQLASALKDEPWREVAEFAAYGCQMESLSLKPWESPPVHVDENDPNEQDKIAQHLLRRMLAAGVSRYEPSPMTALRQAKRKRQSKTIRKLGKAGEDIAG
jgi:hypothetical protein